MKESIYKTQEAKAALMKLYDEKLAACDIAYEDLYVNTFAGKTHVIATGDKHLPPLVVCHGINAGAPVALEAVKGLRSHYRIYAVDTVGQVSKSAETRLRMNSDEYGRWLAETMEQLQIGKAPVIGISYGAYLLQRLMAFAPEKISKGIFVVPSGFVNGPFWESMRKLTLPLFRFFITKTEKDLVKFMDAFYDTADAYSIAAQKNVLLGVKVDYTRPTLLKAKYVARLDAPVYAMVADNDVFFPGFETLERCKVVFKNFKGYSVLENTKHIPEAGKYSRIEAQIKKWLEE